MDLSTCISPSKSCTPRAVRGSPGMGRTAQRSRDGVQLWASSLHSRRPVAQLALPPHHPIPGMPQKLLPSHPFVGPQPQGVQQGSSTHGCIISFQFRAICPSSVPFCWGCLSAESLPIPASAPHDLGTPTAHPT